MFYGLEMKKKPPHPPAYLKHGSRPKGLFHGWPSLCLAILVALVVRWLFLEPYVIPSGSMLPTILLNDHIFVNKMKYACDFRSPKNGCCDTMSPDPGTW